MNNLEDKVNEAITNYLSVLYDLDSLNGNYEKEVVQIINDIATYATNNVLWSSDDDGTNVKHVRQELTLMYPYLTEAAKIKIADIAAYFWR